MVPTKILMTTDSTSPPFTYLTEEILQRLKRGTFNDIREALGAIVTSYNVVEQNFCEAIAYSIEEDVDSSPLILKARRYIDRLKQELANAVKAIINQTNQIAEFDRLMKRFDDLQAARNDCLHSRWFPVEEVDQKPAIRIRIEKDGNITVRDIDADELRKLANDIEDFGREFSEFFREICPKAKADYYESMTRFLRAEADRSRQRNLDNR